MDKVLALLSLPISASLGMFFAYRLIKHISLIFSRMVHPDPNGLKEAQIFKRIIEKWLRRVYGYSQKMELGGPIVDPLSFKFYLDLSHYPSDLDINGKLQNDLMFVVQREVVVTKSSRTHRGKLLQTIVITLVRLDAKPA